MTVDDPSPQSETCYARCGQTLKTVLRCTGCKTGSYCSKVCQKEHWPQHNVICKSIKVMVEREVTSIVKVQEAKGQVYTLSPNTAKKLVKVVGDPCVVKCNFNGVSMVHRDWLAQNFPSVCVRPIEEVVEGGLNIFSANGTFDGWVEIEL